MTEWTELNWEILIEIEEKSHGFKLYISGTVLVACVSDLSLHNDWAVQVWLHWFSLFKDGEIGPSFFKLKKEIATHSSILFFFGGEHPQHLTRYDKGKAFHKFKVFIFQYPLCFSLFDYFLHFKIKANRHGGWLLWQFLRQNASTIKNSRIQFPCFKFVEPRIYRITFLEFCIRFQHLLLHFLTLASQHFLGSSVYGKKNPNQVQGKMWCSLPL